MTYPEHFRASLSTSEGPKPFIFSRQTKTERISPAIYLLSMVDEEGQFWGNYPITSVGPSEWARDNFCVRAWTREGFKELVSASSLREAMRLAGTILLNGPLEIEGEP